MKRPLIPAIIRRNSLKSKGILLLAASLLLTCLVAAQPDGNETAIVREVSDGDTLKVSFRGQPEKLRLIGIDTPENKANERALKFARSNGQDVKVIVALGKRAADFAQKLLPSGSSLKLEFDVEKRDRFGRLLAYAYLPDGRMLNELIIKSGFAYPMTIPPNVRYSELFKAKFNDAKKERRGLWGDTLR